MYTQLHKNKYTFAISNTQNFLYYYRIHQIPSHAENTPEFKKRNLLSTLTKRPNQSFFFKMADNLQNKIYEIDLEYVHIVRDFIL